MLITIHQVKSKKMKWFIRLLYKSMLSVNLNLLLLLWAMLFKQNGFHCHNHKFHCVHDNTKNNRITSNKWSFQHFFSIFFHLIIILHLHTISYEVIINVFIIWSRILEMTVAIGFILPLIFGSDQWKLSHSSQCSKWNIKKWMISKKLFIFIINP